MNKSQQGFTLIELMIAIVLGLLIVAAGSAIFLSGQRSMGLQIGMAEVQENANFGLATLTHDLRHTNLNTASDEFVNNKIVGSGIILAKENLPSKIQTMTDLESKYLTSQEKNAGATTIDSDQLVIQFKPQYTVTSVDRTEGTGTAEKKMTKVTSSSGLFNCEGAEIKFSVDGETSAKPTALVPTIVQRYYLAEAPTAQQVQGAPKSYVLYCDAGYYDDSSTTIEGLGSQAQQLMQNIEAFKIRFGVKDPAGKLRYTTINEYSDLMSASVTDPKNYYQIVSIDVGVLARSTGPSGSVANQNKQTTFKLAGSDVVLKTDTNNSKFLRQPISQVVAIRNTLGAS